MVLHPKNFDVPTAIGQLKNYTHARPTVYRYIPEPENNAACIFLQKCVSDADVRLDSEFTTLTVRKVSTFTAVTKPRASYRFVSFYDILTPVSDDEYLFKITI